MPISDKRLAEIMAIKDEDIDTSDIPEATEADFRRARVVRPLLKTPPAAGRAAIPTVSMTYGHTGASTKANELGMRPMQEQAYEKRGEQYLLIKSPPASGKSRALMFIAIDKLANQGLRQAIIVVPERSIGASFADEPLSQYGFWADWTVAPRWNLCNAPGTDGGKVNAVGAFLESEDKTLVCTHATFRFAVDKFGVEAFDDRLIAVDEFHHVSANPENKLGLHLVDFIARGRTHIVAMTGSYFRGDAEAVLSPEDEEKFETVVYTYYQQLNGYEYLKRLDIGYYFYSGPYINDILKVLDPDEKTIVHIPNVNARESTKKKLDEVEAILESLGEWQGADRATGFQLIKRPDGRVLKVADLVDDDPGRNIVAAALKDPAQKNNRDHVDIIIALGMAKEGFDWIWCEHALTVGYRSSLTEIVQIIGRATRDAPGKTLARFTNLIAEPDASQEAVSEAVNDTLKAIAASLLMEQVLAPRFEFKPKAGAGGPVAGLDYGPGGYDPQKCNVGFDRNTGTFQFEIKGLATPKSPEAARICRQDLNEVIAAFVQDKTAVERGLFDPEVVPEELTQVRMGKIVRERFPALDDEDQEAVRQHAIAALNLTQKAKEVANRGDGGDEVANTAFVDGVRKIAMDVRELDIDLIDRINPFGEAYAILAKSMSEDRLKHIQAVISAKRTSLSPEEARDLAGRSAREERIIAGFEDILRFVDEHGRAPRHGEDRDIFERLYAVRLDRIRAQPECRELAAPLDRHGLLGEPATGVGEDPAEFISDEDLLAELGGEVGEDDITSLKHVRPREEIRAAEEIANRKPCADFAAFKPLFEAVRLELKSGVRESRRFREDATIRKGEYFILGGQIAYVASEPEDYTTEHGHSQGRLRVIFDNGTESDPLLRSFQRALYKDEAGRRITDPVAGPLFGAEPKPDDLESGTIYVLRSLSDHPYVAAHRALIHKIGVTGGSVETRIAHAAADATYLLAAVEVVETFKLFNINRTRLENLLHRVLAPARLELTIDDRFGRPVQPREWFLVPLPVIREVVERVRDGSIVDFRYDPASASLVPVEPGPC